MLSLYYCCFSAFILRKLAVPPPSFRRNTLIGLCCGKCYTCVQQSGEHNLKYGSRRVSETEEQLRLISTSNSFASTVGHRPCLCNSQVSSGLVDLVLGRFKSCSQLHRQRYFSRMTIRHGQRLSQRSRLAENRCWRKTIRSIGFEVESAIYYS